MLHWMQWKMVTRKTLPLSRHRLFYLLTYCFCFAVGFFHNPLKAFVLGHGNLVPCRLMFTPVIQMLLVVTFRACGHEQLRFMKCSMQVHTETQTYMRLQLSCKLRCVLYITLAKDSNCDIVLWLWKSSQVALWEVQDQV